MPTNTQNFLTQDRTDSTFNDSLATFYDSSEKLTYSSFIVLKKTFNDMTLDTSFTDMGPIGNIGQQYPKHNDLNMFSERTYNRFVGHDIEKKLFDWKTAQSYSEDVYNKYENYITDNTSGIILKIDLSTLLNTFESDIDFSDVIEQSDGCHAKYYFNIRSITPAGKNNLSYEDVIDFYRAGNAQSYFNNVNPFVKSCLSQNRLLYDHFYTHKRKSFILQDFTNSSDYVSAVFYNFRYDNGKLYFSLFRYDTAWGFRYHTINQLTLYEKIYTNTTASTFMFRQHGNTLDNNNGDQHGSYSVVTPNNWGHNPIQLVYDTAPSAPRNTCFGGKIADFTTDFSSINEFESSSIKLVEINDGKQHVQIDDSSWSSVYTIRITTTDNKQFSVPFAVDMTSVDASNWSLNARNVIDLTQCTLFDQNELNTRFDASTWIIEQDIFDTADVLSLQTYDSTLGVLTIDMTSIKVTDNERVFKIVSALSKILKWENYYLNEYILINRNMHNLRDPQNWTRLNVCQDYPERMIEDKALFTPLGPAHQRYLASNIWNSNKCGPDGNSYLLSTWGDAVRYELYSTSSPGVLRVYNFMKNIMENNETIHQSKNYKTNGTYNYGIHGLYNSLLNKVYFVERSFTNPNYPHRFTTQDLGPNTQKDLLTTNIDGTWVGGSKWAKVVADATSIDFQVITQSPKYVFRNIYSFVNENFLKYKQIYYGSWWQYIYDDRIYHGYPSFVNDDTMLIGDSLGNTWESKYTLIQRTATAWHTPNQSMDSARVKQYKRLYTPYHNSILFLWRSDSTTAWGYKSSTALVGASNKTQGVFYRITQNGIDLFPVVPYTVGSEGPSWTQTIFIDDTLFYQCFYSSGQYIYKQHINIEDGTSDQTYWGNATTGKIAFPDLENRLIYCMRYDTDNSIYTFNIDTDEITYVAAIKYPRVEHLYSQVRDFDTGHYYFLGTNSDDTEKIILVKSEYDIDTTTWNVLSEQEIQSFPYYGITTNSSNLWFGESNYLVKRNNSIIGVNGDTGQTFDIPLDVDQSILVCRSTQFISIDDTVDREYTRMILPLQPGPYYAIWYKNLPALLWKNAIFHANGYDPAFGRVMHQKLFDCPYSQYIDKGFFTGYDDSTSASYQKKYGYQFATEYKHYVLYPANKMWCYVKYDTNMQSSYIPKYSHRDIGMDDWTLETGLDAYTNGWNIDNDVQCVARNSSSSYSVGGVSYYYRYIEQRKYDTLLNFQKIYRPAWKDTYATGIYGTIPLSQRNINNPEQIDLCSNSGCIFSWNSKSNSIGKVNVWLGKAGSAMRTRDFGNPTENFVITGTQYQNTPSGSTSPYSFFVYNKKRNRWYQFPRYDQSKLNISPTQSLYSFYCGGDHLLVPFGISVIGRSYYYGGANCDSQMLMRFNTFFLPNPPDIYRQYWDDNSNMVQTHLTDYYIVSKPKFYNNIFSTDICPSTFDEYSDAVHTMIDDRWQALGVGMQWWKDSKDSIYTYKMHLNTSVPATDFTWIRNGKINNEVSFNYRTLRYQRHNICAVAYPQNNGNNLMIGSMAANLLSDFTTVDFTQVDSSTLFVGGLIKFDWTINAGQETIDLGRYYDNIKSNLTMTRTDLWGGGQDDTMTRKVIWLPVSCQCISTPFSQSVNFSDITSSSVTEYNDFYISLNVIDGTSQSTTISINNPKNSFIEFGDNKNQWVARAAFFKEDSTPDSTLTQISNFVTVPHAGRIVQARQDYSNAGITSSYYYENKYLSRYTKFETDTTADLWYAVPLLYVPDTSILWFVNDLSNRLFSVQLGTGSVIEDYTNIKVRYKKPHGNTFQIWYDNIIGDDFIRYFGVLGTDGTLSEIDKRDILTTHIIENKNYDVSEFEVTAAENIIQIVNGDTTVSGINIGNKCEFRCINWYFDSSDLMWVSIGIRNFHSHTTDEHILLINKTSQKWDIEGKRFGDLIQDGTRQVSLPNIMKQLFKNSNGIIAVKDSVNYPLFSKLICFYDGDSKSIKYFDYNDGLIYKLEDVIVYDGVFFYRGLPTTYNEVIPTQVDPIPMPFTPPTKKEFAIWDKMYPSMQYLDELPNVFFYPYKCEYDTTNTFGSQVDYIYDASTLYLLVNFGSSINKVNIDMDAIVLVNWSMPLATWAVENIQPDYTTETLIDFTGYFPYGLIALERRSKWLELVSSNRLVRLAFDLTFLDWSNAFPGADFITSEVGIDNTLYNPYTNVGLFTQKLASVTAMKTGTTLYKDFTNNTYDFTNRLMPYQNWRSAVTSYYDWLQDNSGHFEYMLDPMAATENVWCLCFTPLMNEYGQKMTSAKNYFAYFKHYLSRVAVKVTMTYNTQMYSLIDAGMKGKDVDLIGNYTYAYMDSTLRAYDWKRIAWSSNPNKLYNFFTGLTDNSYLRKTNNQTWGVIFGDQTYLPTNVLGGPGIADYAGSVDITAQRDGIPIDQTNALHWGQFTFTSDITANTLYGLFTELTGNTSIAVDITLYLKDATGELLLSTNWSGSPVDFNSHVINTLVFGETSFRQAEIIIRRTSSANQYQAAKIWGMFFYKSALLPIKHAITTQSNPSSWGLVANAYDWPHRLKDSMTLYSGGQNDGTNRTITVIGRPEMLGFGNSDCTLFMNGYDGTYTEIDSGSNSWQKHDFTLDQRAIGFKVNVKPETSKSVPVIKIVSDSTDDNFGSGSTTKFSNGYIKGLK